MKRSTAELSDKVAKATEYLKSIGCKEIILFGSLADGSVGESPDIDLAVSGIHPGCILEPLLKYPRSWAGKWTWLPWIIYLRISGAR